MRRSTILISISLAAVSLSLFVVDARMNPPKASPSPCNPYEVQSVRTDSTLKQEADNAPFFPTTPSLEVNAVSSAPIPFGPMQNPNSIAGSLPNPNVPGKESTAADSKNYRGKTGQSAPQYLTGNISQDASVEARTELPPIVVPLGVYNSNSPATLPAVLIESLPTENFTTDQLAGINKLTEDFIKTVTDPIIPQDPQNPEYQQRWRSAQATADDLFRTRYGDFAWLQRHNAAHREILLKGGK